MDATRFQMIFTMGLMAFALRALPQLFFVGRNFPEAWDRFLRYLSYAFICSIIAITLFMTGARFDAHAAPFRAAALLVTIVVAHRTQSALKGMLSGALLVSILSYFG
jgi:branched-subunit amino acid transport protein